MNTMGRLITICVVLAMIVAGCGKKPSQPAADNAAAAPAKPPGPPAAARSAADATTASIAFLKGNQNEDGSFGKQVHDVGITGLALYGIAKSTQAADAEAKQVLDKGVAFILANVRDDASINNDPTMLAVYRTSIAVMALNAIDAQKHKDVIEKAQAYLKQAQFSEKNGNFTAQSWEYGGWGYSSKPDTMGKIAPDLSNLQFAVTALKESGLPQDDEAYRRAIAFIQRCQNRTESNDMPTRGDDGGAYYAPKESKAGPVPLADGTTVYKSYGSMTYALLKSYLFCGLGKDDPRVKAAYDWIAQHYSIDENPGMGQMGLFYYFMTMAQTMAAMGEDTVKTPDGRSHDWRAELAKKIVSMQAADGSWSNPQDRWMESDPGLVTGYALTVLDLCRKQ